MNNKLFINETFIKIVAFDTESKILASQIPYVHKNRKGDTFYTTIRNIDFVLRIFRGFDKSNVDKLPINIKKIYDKEMQRREITNALLEYGPTQESEVLWKHQQLGREIAAVNPKFAFFFDTRTGKTPMSLQIIADDLEQNPQHKWLIICPLINIENTWLIEANKFFPDLEIVNLYGKTRHDRLIQFQKKANIYIMNTEAFVRYLPQILALKIHGCIIDESSTMKSPSSDFSKAIVEYSSKLKRLYLLSGTPAPNGEWEYYRQLQSIDYYGVHQSFNQFKQYFFINMSKNPQYDKLHLRSDKKEEFLFLLRKYSLYVNKEDVLDTPGREFIEVNLDMPTELKEHYEHLRKKLYIKLGDNVIITSPSTAANLNKLNQVTSGFIIDTDSEETYLLSTYRFEKLKELLNQLGDKQAIIWCNYRKEFEIIKEYLKENCGLVYGGVDIKQKTAAITDFKKGNIQYLVANPASADKGLTLTNTHIAIYFSLNYSYELFKQSMERIYGDKKIQPNKCLYYIFIAKGTIDRVIYRTIMNKGDMSSAVLEHLKGGGI